MPFAFGVSTARIPNTLSSKRARSLLTDRNDALPVEAVQWIDNAKRDWSEVTLAAEVTTDNVA